MPLSNANSPANSPRTPFTSRANCGANGWLSYRTPTHNRSVGEAEFHSRSSSQVTRYFCPPRTTFNLRGNSTSPSAKRKFSKSAKCPSPLKHFQLLDTENKFCRLVKVCKRGEGGTQSVTLTKYWKPDSVVAYAFAVRADGNKASNTLFLSLE